MTFQDRVLEIKRLLKHFDKSNRKLITTHLGILQEWEREFLFSIMAVKNINNDLVIASEYPMLSITKSNGEETIRDLDGDSFEINKQIGEIKAGTTLKGKLKYYPRNYSAYKKAKSELQKETDKDEFIAEKLIN